MKGKTAAPLGRADGGLRPWHLLLLGALASASAGAVVTGGTGTANTILIVITIAAAAVVAMGVFRTLSPYLSPDAGEQTDMLAGRTRAALEREKMLVLRSIKEVEFDRAMRKISEADFKEMSNRLRRRAAGLLRQLDGDTGYRAWIERDLAARLGSPGVAPQAQPEPSDAPGAEPSPCQACGTANDADARFCKHCGEALAGGRS